MTSDSNPAREIFIALTNAAEGNDDEFNEWYSNVHIPEVLALPGFISAQRYRVPEQDTEQANFRYLTIYEVEGSAAKARDLLFQAGTGMSPTLDLERLVFAPYVPFAGTTAD